MDYIAILQLHINQHTIVNDMFGVSDVVFMKARCMCSDVNRAVNTEVRSPQFGWAPEFLM